jgi:D-hexose-6-phosphate mutarotase
MSPMPADKWDNGGSGERLPVTVVLRRETADRLKQFCADHHVTPDAVAERALEEYFRVGDLGH